MSICIGCKSILEISSYDKIYCDDEECKKIYYSTVTDDIIINNYKNDKEVFHMILDNFYSIFNAVGAEEKLKPIPLINGINSYNELVKVIKRERLISDYKDLYENINGSSSDKEIYEKIGMIEYNIIKYLMSNNRYKMEYSRGTENYEIYRIVYSSERELELSKIKNTSILFHGSSYYNWYTIIKCGLKVYSGTKLMTAGSAYGNGIYLSDNYGLSIGYSGGNNQGIRIIGIVQILDNKDKYKKIEHIFVVPDEKMIVLREIIVIKKEDIKNTKLFNTYINNYNIQGEIIKTSDKITDKRLNMEMKKISKMENIRVLLVEKDRWIINMIYEYEIVNVEIRYINYPFNPPIVKIIEKPEINVSEYIKMLEVSRWKISNNVAEILKMLQEMYERNFI